MSPVIPNRDYCMVKLISCVSFLVACKNKMGGTLIGERYYRWSIIINPFVSLPGRLG